MIIGYSGAGKTALMRHLAKEWANTLEGFDHTNGVKLLLHLGRLSKDKEPHSLSDLLQLLLYSDLDFNDYPKKFNKDKELGHAFS